MKLSDLSEIMFDAWTQASLLGRITPSVYWKHLGELAQDWITYVSLNLKLLSIFIGAIC
jgi:hypothetical protein